MSAALPVLLSEAVGSALSTCSLLPDGPDPFTSWWTAGERSAQDSDGTERIEYWRCCAAVIASRTVRRTRRCHSSRAPRSSSSVRLHRVERWLWAALVGEPWRRSKTLGCLAHVALTSEVDSVAAVALDDPDPLRIDRWRGYDAADQSLFILIPPHLHRFDLQATSHHQP